jgi:hypothetical protein
MLFTIIFKSRKNRADFYQRMLMMMMIVMGINIANTKYGGARIIESSA